MNTQTESAPTAKQLRCLRAMAHRTATTFAYPRTRAHASAEIARLRRLAEQGARSSASEAYGEEGRARHAPAVDPEEIASYGSSARWRGAVPQPAGGRR